MSKHFNNFIKLHALAIMIGMVAGLPLSILVKDAYARVIYPPSASLSTGDITTTHVADGAILNADINNQASISFSKLDLNSFFVRPQTGYTGVLFKVSSGSADRFSIASNGRFLFGGSGSVSANFEVGGYASVSSLTVGGSSLQTLDATLTALAAYNTAGILTQTAADTFVGRTLTGTTNQLTITNGDGVAGNPTFSIPSFFSITAASLSGNFETAGYGEFSGLSSNSVQGDIYYRNTNHLTRLAPGTSGQVLQTGGAGANPSWAAAGASYTAGTVTLKALDTEYTITTSTAYILAKEIKAARAGTLTVKFTLRSGNAGQAMYGKIYLDDVATGTERANDTVSNVEYSEDFTVSVGTKIQLYVKVSACCGLKYYSTFGVFATQPEVATGTVDSDLP